MDDKPHDLTPVIDLIGEKGEGLPDLAKRSVEKHNIPVTQG